MGGKDSRLHGSLPPWSTDMGLIFQVGESEMAQEEESARRGGYEGDVGNEEDLGKCKSKAERQSAASGEPAIVWRECGSGGDSGEKEWTENVDDDNSDLRSEASLASELEMLEEIVEYDKFNGSCL